MMPTTSQEDDPFSESIDIFLTVRSICSMPGTGLSTGDPVGTTVSPRHHRGGGLVGNRPVHGALELTDTLTMQCGIREGFL